MGQEILVAPIVIDRIKEIKAGCEECLRIFNENPNLKEDEPYEATHELEDEVKRASEGIDASVYLLQELVDDAAGEIQ